MAEQLNGIEELRSTVCGLVGTAGSLSVILSKEGQPLDRVEISHGGIVAELDIWGFKNSLWVNDTHADTRKNFPEEDVDEDVPVPAISCPGLLVVRHTVGRPNDPYFANSDEPYQIDWGFSRSFVLSDDPSGPPAVPSVVGAIETGYHPKMDTVVACLANAEMMTDSDVLTALELCMAAVLARGRRLRVFDPQPDAAS